MQPDEGSTTFKGLGSLSQQVPSFSSVVRVDEGLRISEFRDSRLLWVVVRFVTQGPVFEAYSSSVYECAFTVIGSRGSLSSVL